MNTQLNELRRLMAQIDSLVGSVEVTGSIREARQCAEKARSATVKAVKIAAALDAQPPSLPPELWAVHAQGPDELYAAFSREDAEKHAAELNALTMPEGISVGAVVMPSPWPAAEHWMYLAEQEREHGDSARAALAQPSPVTVRDDDMVSVPSGLLGSAIHAIRCQVEGPNTLAKLREYAYSRVQPSPAPEQSGASTMCHGCFEQGVSPDHFDSAGKCKARQAPELERPEVVAWLNTATGTATSHQVQVMDWDDEKEPVQSLMTVAQHDRIIGVRAEAIRLLADSVVRLRAERDAAQARLTELEKQEPVAWRINTGHSWRSYDFEPDALAAVDDWKRDFPNGEVKVFPLYASPVAQAGQVPEGCAVVPIEPTGKMVSAFNDYSMGAAEIYRAMLAAAPAQGGSTDE